MNIFKNQKIIITGGTGMVGIALTNLLLELEAKITVVTLDDFNPFDERVECIKKDLRYFQNCLDVCKDKDYIFHLAGIKGFTYEAALKQPASFFVPTVLFNTLFQAAYGCYKHILYTSSVGVYSQQKYFMKMMFGKLFPSENDKYAGWAKIMW